MTQAVMNFGQQYLPEGEAVRLPAGQARLVQVTAGRLWLTRTTADTAQSPADCWLLPGDRVLLGAGDDAVLEGWPSASYRLQPARPGGVTASAAVRWWQGWRAGPSRPTPASAGPCAQPCASR